MDRIVTVDALAVAPRWDEARSRTLPGRNRGDLLGAWGDNLVRRFGQDALVRVRRRLAPPLDSIASSLTERDWLPVYAQLLVTEAIVDELLGGDMRALYPLIVEDTRASMGRVQRMLLKTVGLRGAFRLAPHTFRKVHERGAVEGEVTRGAARFAFSGTPLFTHPSWRMLQLFAMRVLLDVTGTAGEVVGEHAGPDSFVAIATW